MIHAHVENDNITKRILRDRSVKATDGSAAAAKLSRKRKLEQQVNDVKKRKPGRPPGRPPVLLSPGISAKGPLPAGWSVSLKDSKKEPGKQYKQYKVQQVSELHASHDSLFRDLLGISVDCLCEITI